MKYIWIPENYEYLDGCESKVFSLSEIETGKDGIKKAYRDGTPYCYNGRWGYVDEYIPPIVCDCHGKTQLSKQ